jgi:hypothetical protein
MRPPNASGDDPGMPTFLIEVHAADADERELERAVLMLSAAQARMRGSVTDPQQATAGFSREDGRLLCLIAAPSREAAQLVVGVSLPPGTRIREITQLAGARLLGSHPGGDVDPGIEAKLVEDVVDMSLDGSLGEE